MGRNGKGKANAKPKAAAPAAAAEAERIAQIGYWDLDLQRNALTWSDEIYRIFEIDSKHFRASYEAFLDAIHPEDREYVHEAYTGSVRSRVPYNIVHRLLMKDGRVKYVRERCETSYDAAGHPLRSIGTVQDITEQRLTFEALRASETLLRAKYDEAAERAKRLAQAERIANVGSWEVDLAANRMFYSDEAMRIHGLSAGSFDGTLSGAIALAHPEDRLRVTAAINATLYEGKPFDIEYRIVRPDGSMRYVHAQDEVVRDASGTPVRAFGITQDVTARIRTEDTLRQTVVELKEAQRLAHVGSWRLDSSTNEVVWTEEIYNMLRLDPNLPPPPYDQHRRLFAAESWDRLAASLQRTQDAGVPYELELEMLRADGGKGWMLARGEAVKDLAGRIVGVRGTAQDITERIGREEALRRFRTAMDTAGDAIALIDRAGMRYADVNQTLCDLLGYTREEMLAMSPNDVFIANRQDLERDYDAIIADKDCAASKTEGKYRRKDGRLIPVESQRRALRTKDGWIIVATARDITERKLAEKDLRRFRLAMDSTQDSIYLTDPVTMRFVDVNKAACERLGYTREQLLGMGPHDAIGADRAEVEQDFQKVLAAGAQGIKFERPFVTSDGRRGWTELYRKSFRLEDELLFVTVGRDVTERKLADMKIARLNRIHSVLSGINSAIVRIRDRQELFDEACRIAVDAGGFKLAWIGMVDTSAMQIRPTAWRGPEDAGRRLMEARFALATDQPDGAGFVSDSVRTKKMVIVNDVPSDSRILSEENTAAFDIRAVASLPLMVDEEPVGVLALHSAESGFFDETEIRLLLELAGDISFAIDHIQKSEKVDYLAYFDELTGLANRHLFLERLQQSIYAAGQMGEKLALIVVDVERLGTINESLGRHAGDALLKCVSQRLERAVGSNDVARISSDNFAVMFRAVKGRSEVMRRVERLWQDCFGEPIRVGDSDLRSAARGGIAIFHSPTDAESLLRNAEAALRTAKRSGERHVFHAPEMTARTAEKLSLENRIRMGLERQEFLLHYQPKINLETGRIVGVEALIRWNSPDLGLVPPGRFIPLMEETGLIMEAGQWVLRQAVQDHKRWTDFGDWAPRVAVNVSALQLRRKDYLAALSDTLRDGVAPAGIDLEITESVVMEDIQGNIEKLREVRNLGVGIAIDDFGTGYSSLGYLAKLPVEALKIDRSFVRHMLEDQGTMTLVQTIISLAHSLRLRVVAEGVETRDQLRILRLLRCDEMQGYLFSKPVPFDEMTKMLANRSAFVLVA